MTFLKLRKSENRVNSRPHLTQVPSSKKDSFISAGQLRCTSGGFRGKWSPQQLHIPVRTGGIFYFPWHRHHIEGTNGNGFYRLIRKTYTGKAG